METNVIDFAAAVEANKVAKGDLAPSLRELANLAEKQAIRNIFIAWAMEDGSVHYGHAHLSSAATTLNDDHLRLIGLIRIAEKGFVDALSFKNQENNDGYAA